MPGAFVAGSIVSKLILDATPFLATTKKVSGKVATFGAGFAKVGKGLTMGLTLPLAAAGTAAVKVAADFEQSIVNAISVTGEEIDVVRPKMEALAREMGQNTVFSASQAAEAMYSMASAGYSVDDMGKAIQPTLNLAAATQTDLKAATDTVVSSLNQFMLGSEGASRVSNVFAAAISGSQATMEKLSVSMRYVGPVANSMGISIEQTTASLMGLYDAGFDASQAGTALRMGMAKLLDPSKKAAAAMERLGISANQVNPEINSMADIIELLGEKGAGTKDIIDLVGIRAGPAFAALLAQGSDALRENEAAITGTNRSYEMAEMQVATFQGSMQLLKSALEEAAISVGQVIAPVIRDFVDNKLKPAIQWFNNLSDSTKQNIVKWGALVAAIGPAMMIIGKLMMLLPKVVSGVNALGVALKFLAMNPLVIAAAAVAYYVVKLMEQKKAQDAAREAEERYVQASAHLNNRLEEIRKAAGLTAEEWQKLTDKYDGNRTALVQAINRGKEGKKLLDAMRGTAEKNVEAQKKLNEETKKGTVNVADITAEFKKYEEGLEDTEGQLESTAETTKTYLDYLADKGILTIEQKAQKVGELDGYVQDLNQAYKDGKIDADAYAKAIKGIKEEIDETAVTIQTEIPKAHLAWEDAAGIVGNATDEMETHVGDFTGAVQVATVEQKSLWGELADGIQTKLATMWADLMQDPSWDSFKTFFKDFLGSIWTEFTVLVGNMIAKWTVDLIGGMVKGSAGMAEKVVGGFKDVTKGATDLISGFSPGGMIATGIGAAVGTFLGGLIGGGGAGKRDTQLIKDNTWETAQHAKNAVLNLDAIKWVLWNVEPMLNDVKLTGWSIYELLKVVPNTLKAIMLNTNAMVKELRAKKGGQQGAVITKNDMMFVHGSPSKPEYLIPHDQLPAIASQQKTVNVKLEVNNKFAFNNQVDENFTRKYVERDVMPNMMKILDSNIFLTTLKERLGVV